ncbi:MAG TPA: hypothetical protein VHI13_05050 [Candidatus Kapabacteria bacterium]|nr:hypothetical protein [Candidatus Kapabacteria bacterium]
MIVNNGIVYVKQYLLLAIFLAGCTLIACASHGDLGTRDSAGVNRREAPEEPHVGSLLSIIDLDSIPPVEYLEDSMYVDGKMVYDGQRIDLRKHDIYGPIVDGWGHGPLDLLLAHSIRHDSASLAQRYSRSAYVVVTGSWMSLMPSVFLAAIFTNEHAGCVYCIYAYGHDDKKMHPVQRYDIADASALDRAISDTLRSSYEYLTEGPHAAIIVTYNQGVLRSAAYMHLFSGESIGAMDPPQSTPAKLANRKNLNLIVGIPLQAAGIIKRAVR